jgi:amidase
MAHQHTGPSGRSSVSRRDFLRATALATSGAALAASVPQSVAAADPSAAAGDVAEASIAELQAAMTAGSLTAVALVTKYIARIQALDRNGPRLNSVVEVNPDALAIAEQLDRERRERGPRGPLHGIPILIKDNIDTADRMQTTAGSLALFGAPPPQDSTVAAKLRAAGAVILGRTNLSEWANYRSTHSSSGWCARNGQSRNPNVLDRNPCGSSSGSGIATGASLAAASIGSETDGSIVCPANNCGVVGIKPTVGLVSRAGIVPISFTQDTAGPHGRTVADAATLLGPLTGVDPRDSKTSGSAGRSFPDYTRFLDKNGLEGARIGVLRNVGFGSSPKADAIIEQALAALKEAGATLVDPANIPSDLAAAGNAEDLVLSYEFKFYVNQYLATRHDVALDREGFARTLDGLIQFNEKHAAEELKWFGQEIFLTAQPRGPLTTPEYVSALQTSQTLSGPQGIDAVLKSAGVQALVAPTGGPAWTTDLVNGDHFSTSSSGPGARAGYPTVTVPAGYSFGLPVNISFIGTAYSEATLIKLAYAYEQATKVRKPPQFVPTLPLA